MKKYLLNYFAYNDWANRKLLDAIVQLSDKTEALRLFSHLITSQDKWLNRIVVEQDDTNLSWFGEVFGEGEILEKWGNSIGKWQAYLQTVDDTALEEYVYFTGNDGRRLKVLPKDVAFQMNCHSVHHRAQINKILSTQGVPVPATDYIRTAVSSADTE